MSKFKTPVEIKISKIDLLEILTTHMNAEIFREDHEVMAITMHVKGDYACTMTVDPILNHTVKHNEAMAAKEKKS
jgi:hypothetical protein